MLPRTIGIAVLRLCVNSVGLQPISEVILDDSRPSCFFNTGQFVVPLLYGQITEDMDYITEAKLQDQLHHIEGAFARISLVASMPGDEVIDHPFPSSFNRESSMASSIKESDRRQRIDTVCYSSTTVASVMWRTYISLMDHYKAKQPATNSNNSYHSFGMHGVGSNGSSSAAVNTAKLHIPVALLTKFQQGEALFGSDLDTVLAALKAYVTKSFEHGALEAAAAAAYATTASGLIHGMTHHSAAPKLGPPPMVNSQYLMEYVDHAGTLVALDMLHNMPERKALINAAEQAASIAAIKSGFSREWDDKISCFKTIFRYLPGTIYEQEDSYKNNATQSIKQQSIQEEKAHDAQELIIDDASVKPYLQSTELNPIYQDDYSCTAGMQLGPFACVLVVVTAVDVLTRRPINHKAGDDEVDVPNMPLTPAHSKAPLITEGSMRSLHSATNSVYGANTHPHGQVNEHPSKKLPGLLGIYVGQADPGATWWGLMPVFQTLPAYLLNSLPSKGVCAALPAVHATPHPPAAATPTSGQGQVGKALASPAGTPKSAHSPMKPAYHQVSTVHEGVGGREHSTLSSQPSDPLVTAAASVSSPTNHLNSDGSAHPTHLTVDTGVTSSATMSNASVSAMNNRNVGSWPLFVNDGTHQIPLFEGLPPEDMIVSPDPMLWLANQLDTQYNKGGLMAQVSSVSSMNSSNSLRTAATSLSSIFSPLLSLFQGVASPKKPRSKKQRKRKLSAQELAMLNLSSGSSAIVRLANPRMRRMASPSIVDHRDKAVHKFTLEYLLKIIAQASKLPGGGSPDHAENELYYIIDPQILRILNSLVADNSKLKTLKQQFAYTAHQSLMNNHQHQGSSIGLGLHLPAQPFTASSAWSGSGHHKYNKRTLEVLMQQEGLDTHELISQINQKFYETLS